MSQNKPGFLRDPIWTFVGVLIALAALLFAVFIWAIPKITATIKDKVSARFANMEINSVDISGFESN